MLGKCYCLAFIHRGMSFVDMTYLKKDLNNDVLSYRRKKTGQRLFNPVGILYANIL